MSKKVYIFGAHSRAQTLGVYLGALRPELRIEAYLTDNDEKNEKFVGNVPVLHIDKDSKLDPSIPVYLGTRGIYHQKITSLLTQIGVKEIIPVTPALDMELRNQYLRKYYGLDGWRPFDKLEDYSAACIYVARSIFDQPLQGNYPLRAYEREIQVGASLTGERIADITDDTGHQISAKNRQFCELTGMYWIWKNAKEDIVGLEHYRRRFLLPENWKERMEYEHIDVILPTPLCVMPSIAENYRNRHVPSDWDYMMDFLKMLYPEDYHAAQDFFEANLYSPCNMFIVRKQILDALCAWIFPIIFACAEHGGERTDSYQNRYPGFLSERLLTFFFERHRDKYRIVYADKNFLE